MAENKEKKVMKEAQEPLKKYKITCGTFRTQKEALQSAAEAKKSGIPVLLTICKKGYTLLYVDDITKTDAEALKKEIDAKKLKVDIVEKH